MYGKNTFIKKETAEVMDELHTSLQGLDSDEAAQAFLARDGANPLEESKPPHPFMIFLSQFKDLLVLILIVAAIISMISGELESTYRHPGGHHDEFYFGHGADRQAHRNRWMP